MQHIGIFGRNRRIIGLSSLAVLVAAALFAGWRSGKPEFATTAHAQQSSIMLEQRLNQVEQRFNYVESRLNRLESESRSPTATLGTSRTNTELTLLRGQMDTMRADIDSLRVRTGELECAILKLDQRTLSPGVRAAKPPTGPNQGDPCRADPNSVIKLSSRP